MRVVENVSIKCKGSNDHDIVRYVHEAVCSETRAYSVDGSSNFGDLGEFALSASPPNDNLKMLMYFVQVPAPLISILMCLFRCHAP